MKVTDLRRKLLAALAAGGMLAPSAVFAANLNENLVINGGFENVDVATTGSYRAPLILDWTPLNVDTRGFAYSHDGSSSNAGVVPNYANGAAPPTSGHWYFTSNKSGGPTPPLERIDQPGEFYQDIDVSSGDSAALIAQGIAGFNLSGAIKAVLAGSVLMTLGSLIAGVPDPFQAARLLRPAGTDRPNPPLGLP